MKKNWIEGSTWIFLTKLYHYNLSEDIKNLFMDYQKSSQQYTEEKFFKMWRFMSFLRPLAVTITTEYLLIYLFSIYLSLANFISSYN